MENETLYLIDAMALCYRGFYALGGLATSSGFPTGAIYGFLSIFLKILREEKVKYIGVCFDVSRRTFRQEMFQKYKMQRPETPDEFKQQVPVIKELLSAYNIAVVEKEGFEADDVIATLAKEFSRRGFNITVISQDKDMLQVVDENVSVVYFQKNKKNVCGVKEVKARYGVEPGQVIDVISLAGDSADNIPGVKGVGEKTAVKLIRRFGSAEGLIANSGGVKQAKLRKQVEESRDLILMNKELVKLRTDLSLGLKPEDLEAGEPDYKKLYEIFRRLEFKSMLKALPDTENIIGEPGITVIEVDDARLREYARGISEAGICRISSEPDCEGKSGMEGMFFYINGSILKVACLQDAAREILADAKIMKFGYDLKSINALLLKNNIPVSGINFDLLVAAYICDVTKGDFSLKALACDYLDEHLPSSISPEQTLALCARLKPVLEKIIFEQDLGRLFYNVEMPLVEVLAFMEYTGVGFDTPYIKQLSEQINARLDILVRDIYTLSGREFNLNSPKQLAEVLFSDLKLTPVRKTKTGYSTDEGVLRQLKEAHEVPGLILDYRQLTKLKTTYVDVLPLLVDGNTGRIHASFNQAVAETGRLSSSNPNLQNIPLKSETGQKIRRAFIAAKESGYILSADYSQIELRVLAHLSDDENMKAAFMRGEDIHLKTAALIHGVNEKDVSPSMREVAKRINFGITYGLSAFGLANDLKINIEDARLFIDSYFRRYPRVSGFISECVEKARSFGFAVTLMGRRRFLPEINSKNQSMRMFAERQAVNTPVQGTAADIIKLAMVNIHKKFRDNKLRSRMIMQVHDELVFDVCGTELAKVKSLVKQEMEDCFSLSVPLKVDLAYGRNWLDLVKS